MFRKYQQQGIKEWRTQYNRSVESHYSALASGTNPPGRGAYKSSASGPVGLLAEQTARRHVVSITQYVAGEPAAGMAAGPFGAACGRGLGRANGQMGMSRGVVAAIGSVSAAPDLPASDDALRRFAH